MCKIKYPAFTIIIIIIIKIIIIIIIIPSSWSEAEGAEGPLEQPDSEDFHLKLNISSCIYDWVKF